MTVVDALLAVAAGDRAAVLRAVDGAVAAAPDDRLPSALARHLRAGAGGDVYATPEALTRFIDGGSNVALYDAVHADLRTRYAGLRPSSLLDLGSGDGRVVRAVLPASVTRVDLVEPSEPLLALAVPAVATGVVDVRGHVETAAAFLTRTGDDPAARWDVAESTFALHTMPAEARAPVLRTLAGRVGHLVLAEFDMPPFADRSREHAAYAADRYERGLREYDGDDVVAQGFLMPVLVGQFAPGAVRHTHEQSVDAWLGELRAAGFHDIATRVVFPAWWADVVVFDATP